MNKTGLGKETYSVSAACGNCGYAGNITAKKGVRVEGTYPCPNCGCQSLVKKWN